MPEHPSVHVARIGKPHGLHGEVTVQLHTDEPERRLAVGAVLPTEAARGTGVPRALTVRSTRVHNGTWLVAFEEIPDRTGAESLRGTHLVVEGEEALPAADDEDVWSEEQLRGLAVVDPEGTVLGEVSGLELGSAQDRLVVRLPDGRRAQVPFVAAMVPEVDLECGPGRRRPAAGAARPRGVSRVRVDVVSIFPDYLAPLDLSLIGRARRDGILEVHVHDLRRFAHDRHRTVDDSPFGGGAGMVMKPEPWAEALAHVVAEGATDVARTPHLVVPGPGGVPFTQGLARRLAAEPWLAFACGRYEGIDERVYEHAAERMPVTVVSLGDYVLNGGEVAVLAVVEAVGRLLPGVVGNAESLVEESHEDGLLEYPVYTRPARWDDEGTVRDVPPVLLSGDHRTIATWRHEQRLRRTASRRPDLLPVSATTGALADLDVRVATPADAAELLVLQRACWVREGLAAQGRWVVPPLAEELSDVVLELGEWTTYAVRVRAAGGSPGRLVASVRGRLRPDDARTWEVGRLMVAPDLQGRGLGRQLLELAESVAPPGVNGFWLTTGLLEEGNQRFYRRAGYRTVPGEPTQPGAVDLSKPRR